MVYLQRYLVVMGLVPHETAAVSVHVLCPPYNYAPVYKKIHNSSSYHLWKVMNRSGVLTQHYLVVTGLVPHQTAALSVPVLCAPYNHAPVYTLVFHNSSSYLSVESDRAWSLQAVLLHALEVVQDAPQLGHLGQPAQMQSQHW